MALLFLLTLMFHGWLMPLPAWMPPEFPVVAKEMDFYREADPWGYLEFVAVTRRYQIHILATDRNSEWYKAVPSYFKGAMFVYDTPTIWVDGWNLQATDPGMTVAVLNHELCHVLGRWHPEEQVRMEGIAAPTLDITNWRTWAEQEVYCSNVQLRVAKRLGSAAGVQFALDIAQAQLQWMPVERRQRFLETYGAWVELELWDAVRAAR